MKLPKYNIFNISGITNVFLGSYLIGYLSSKGFNLVASVFLMAAMQIIFIVLYENLRIELESKEKDEGETSNN